jgi:hypothetical protein
MNPQRQKNIETCSTPSGYSFKKYTTWPPYNEEPDDALSRALSEGWAPVEMLLEVVNKLQAEPHNCSRQAKRHNLLDIIEKINERNKEREPIGSLDSLPDNCRLIGSNLVERLHGERDRSSRTGWVISFRRSLKKRVPIAVGIWEVIVDIHSVRTELVVPASNDHASLSMPVSTTGSNETDELAPASLESARLELTILRSMKSKLRKALEQVGEREEFLEERLDLRPGSSSSGTGSVATDSGSLSQWHLA